MSSHKKVTIAVAGNPNSGKSTLINSITKSRLHVGNWTGVTVDIKEAETTYKGLDITFVDLPGCYSLSPYSHEEIIARDFITHEKPDLILNVIDTTNLERSLLLTLQLAELGIPMLIALNIYDEAEAKGLFVDLEKMQQLLSLQIIKTNSIKKEGLEQILDSIDENHANYSNLSPRHLNYGKDIEEAINKIENGIEQKRPELAKKYSSRWLALKLIEKDSHVAEEENFQGFDELVDESTKHLRTIHNQNIESFIADERYALASGLTKEVLEKKLIKDYNLTEKLDQFFLNKYLGMPLFALIMWLVFKLTFDVGNPFVDWLDSIINGPIMRASSSLLSFLSAPEWMVSLFQNGIIAGVGAVIVFVPIIFFMMFFITFLEGSGYMARAAFIMDRTMHRIGLHGKSFIPLLLGFGCNVPALYATRTLENRRDRLMTALLVPLMSCGARLPVYVLLTAVFFPNSGGLVIWLIYLLGIVLAFIMGFLFKKIIFKGESPVFIMELPPYRMPSLKNMLVHTWEKVKHFLIKAGTFILAMSILIWTVFHLPLDAETKKESYLGKTAQFVAPVFEPLGFGTWEASSSLITGIVAKEVVVSTMGEIYLGETDHVEKQNFGLGQELKSIFSGFLDALKNSVANIFSGFTVTTISSDDETLNDIIGREKTEVLKNKLRSQFTPLSALSFMIFVLLYMPCLVVVAVIKFEFGSWRWAGFVVAYQMVLAWLVSFAVYQGGKLLGF
jgi:ferrous iron transport protein B